MQLLKRTLLAGCILLSGCLSTLGWADDSPRHMSYPQNKIMGFLGLDTRSSSPLIQDGRASDLKNIKLSQSFDLTKRFGYSVINDTLDDFSFDSPPITGIFDAKFSTGSNFPIAFIGDKIKYDASGTWTEITNTSTVTSGKNNQWTCVMALDSAVCTNDTDVPLKIDVTPAATALDVGDLSETLTKTKVLIWYKNYLIHGNTVENSIEKPTRFRWSNVGTTETYSDDDFVDIAELGGDEIVGFAELSGPLYAFFKDDIYRITLVGGNDVFVNNKIIDGIGAASRGSIKNVKLANKQLGIVFLDGRKRIYFFDGIGILDIGARIQPTLDDLNEARLQYSVATYDDENYCLSASTSGSSTNNTVLCYQVEIGEWTKYDQIDANAFGRVKTSAGAKTYFGNYKSFVYWMDNPDKKNDIDGTTGIVDSVGIVDTATITGAQFILDSTLPSGVWTGATFKITSGTGAGLEAIIVSSTATGVALTNAFATTPDNTSNYSIGAIEADYTTKWYDFGDSSRLKNFRNVYFWAKEDSDNEVTVSYAEDFGDTLGSETKDLSPAGSTLWDIALWDQGTWGSTGDKFDRIRLRGRGRHLELKFENDDIDETFKLYGFHMIADGLDVR